LVFQAAKLPATPSCLLNNVKIAEQLENAVGREHRKKNVYIVEL